jgi:hypothetical protein
VDSKSYRHVVTERVLIPVEAAPIVCTIGADEIDERIELLTRLRSAARSVKRTDTGLVLILPGSSADDAATFAIDEKRCCSFWGFAVVEEDEIVTLRWDGPPSAADLLDRLHALLRSDDPIEIAGGWI